MNSYGTRCIIDMTPESINSKKYLYEERITVWRANDIDEAIDKSEKEVREYCKANGGMAYTGLCQAYWMFDSIEKDGVEVFSLLRESNLECDNYLDRFFSTEDEKQKRSEPAGAGQPM